MSLIYAQGGDLADTGGGLVQAAWFENFGVHYTGRRPCFVWYRGDLYCIGYYTRPVVRHAGNSGDWNLGGVRAPLQYLNVAPGASDGGSSGACLAAITFLHKLGPKVLAESNFGNVVDVGMLSGEGRSWTNIDHTTGEFRVTHVRGYVSMDGGDFRCAWEAPYGVIAYEENLRTTQLTYAGPDGFNHGIPPSTAYGHAWAGRMWYANARNHPYRVWYSEPGYPQYVEPSHFLDTWDKEAITAIWKGRNELLVFCERACYMVRQFGAAGADFVMEKLDSDVGCISHFGIQEIHNRLWFPSEDGPWIYDGAFRYLGKEIQPLWRADYEAHRDEFHDGFAVHDRINKVYIFVTNRPDREEYENTGLFPGTVAYVGYYGSFDPSMAGDQPHPEWTLDMKDRFDSAGHYTTDGELVFGSCDGVLREQDWTDGDDDGDALQKEAIIRSGHHLFFETGDDWESGKKLLQLWVYIESEATPWTLYVRGGDEQVWRSRLPDNLLQNWKADVPASADTDTRLVKRRDGLEQTLSLEYVPKTTHYMLPQLVTGRGFTFEVRAIAPVGLEYRGIGGLWCPGPGSTRMISDHTRMGISLKWVDPDTMGAYVDFPMVMTTPARFQAEATIAYGYGVPTFPITVTFTVETNHEDYTQTVVLAGPGLVAVGGAGADPPDRWPLTPAFDYAGTVVVTAVDAAGISATSEAGTLTLTHA